MVAGAAARDAVWIDVLPSMKGFGPALAKGADGEAGKAGKATGMIYGKALLAGVAVVAGGAALATKALYDVGRTFDDMTDTIRVGTGATGKALDDLTDSAKNVGTRVPASFEDVGVAIADVNTRLGHTGKPLEDISAQFLELSRITGTDVATNIEKASRVFGDWGIEAEKQGESLDYLFKVSQNTGIGLDELSSKVVQYGAPMRQFGFSFEESAALMGKWAKEGVNTETIMGGMRAGLGKLAKAGKDPAEAFKEITARIKGAGSEGEATAIAIETFGQRAGPDLAAAVREGRFELDDLMGTLEDSGETIMQAGEDTMDFSEQWQMFKNEIMVYVEPAATRLFTAISDGMKWVNDKGIPWAKDFTQTLKDNKATIIAGTIATTAFAVALGALAIAKTIRTWLDGMTLSQKLLNTAMKANPILLVVGLIGTLVTALVWLYNNNEDARRIMDKAWAGIKTAIDAVVKWFRDTAWPAMKSVYDKIKDGASSIRDKFVSVRDGISNAWKSLGNIIARPINSVIEKVNSFLSSMKSALNQIPGVNLTGSWQIKKIILDTASGSVAAGGRQFLASGGRVGGYSPHDRADNVPAMLTAGEYVLPVGATRSLASRFGPGFLEALRRGLPGFASGGRVRGAIGGAFDRGKEWLADFYNNIKGWVRDKFSELMPDFGGSWPGVAAKGALSSVRDLLGSWMERNSGGPNVPMSGGQRVNYGGPFGWHPSGMGWQAIWSLIQSVAPEARMTSNFRPGAITASGVPSLHGQGRAVDIVSSNMAATFQKLLPLLKWSQLYYSPMGGSQIGYRDAAVHRMHFDHIHAAYADGGLVKPFVADSGALLSPGINVLNNKTGGPEPLIRGNQPLPLSRDDLDYLAARINDGTLRAALRGAEKQNDLERMG